VYVINKLFLLMRRKFRKVSKGAATQNDWEALGCIELNAWVDTTVIRGNMQIKLLVNFLARSLEGAGLARSLSNMKFAY